MFAFALALIWGLLTGNTHSYGYGYGYGSPTPTNQGVYVQLDPTHCVGYEITGTPGFFGNTMGLKGGECA